VYRVSWLIQLVDQDRQARRQIHALQRRISELLDEHGTTLRDEPGVGPIIAATLICEVGDAFRFTPESKFGRWSGTGAVALSSGEGNNTPVRHRLDIGIGGNPRVNSLPYIISITQQRDHPAARSHLERKAAEGKTRREARRAHKRHLANRVIRRMWHDEQARRSPHAEAA
jgi:transposase